MSFVLRQDESITDATLPAAAQFGIQATGLGVTILWSAVATVVISRSENELDMAKMHQALNGNLPDDPLPVARHAAAAD